jgi:hypothetical protein
MVRVVSSLPLSGSLPARMAVRPMPMSDQFWGDRYGQVEDPFGHKWSIATHKQDLSLEQIASNAKAFFAQMEKQPKPEMATA